MPAYDFLSGVASAVEKQSNALQAYGLKKREQEREQQERTQYNQVFTELGQFLASGQEIPEERIQTWTSMMGAAPPEIINAFSNAMNMLGQRRQQASQFEVTTGIAQEQNRLARERLRIDQSQFAENLRQKVLDRDRLTTEGALNRAAELERARIAAGGKVNPEAQMIISFLSSNATIDENVRKSYQDRLNQLVGVTVNEQPPPPGASKTPQEWIQSLGNIDDATARIRLLSIRNQFQEGTADRKSVNDAILMLTPDVPGRTTSNANTPTQSITPATNTTQQESVQESVVSGVSYPSNVRSIEDMLNYARSKFEEADRADIISRGTDLSTTRSKYNWKSEVDRLQRLQEFRRNRGRWVSF